MAAGPARAQRLHGPGAGDRARDVALLPFFRPAQRRRVGHDLDTQAVVARAIATEGRGTVITPGGPLVSHRPTPRGIYRRARSHGLHHAGAQRLPRSARVLKRDLCRAVTWPYAAGYHGCPVEPDLEPV